MTAKTRNLSNSFAILCWLTCFVTKIDFFSYFLLHIATFCQYRYVIVIKFVYHWFTQIDHMLLILNLLI